MPHSGHRLRSKDGRRNEVGLRVALQRRKLALSQDTLCAQISYYSEGGWAPRWADVSRIENGVRLVTDVELKLLARVLDCSAAWLLLGEELDEDLRHAPGGDSHP